MEETSDIELASDGSTPQKARCLWASLVAALRSARKDARASRARRVILMLIFIWTVSVCDLALTLLAQEIGGFHEANPLARRFIEHPGATIAFKFAVLVPATTILLLFRHRRLTEISCWILCLAYTVLAFLWAAYYSPLEPA